MQHFEDFPSFYNEIIRLRPNEREKPLEVFENFFTCCDLQKCHKTIRNLQECALLTPNTIYDDGDERFNLIWFCRRIQPVIEAAWLLYQQSLPKKRRSARDETSTLTKEEKDNPIEVIQCFYSAWKLCEVRQVLWDMLECALSADDDFCNEAHERQHVLWFYRYLESVLEAGWLLICNKQYNTVII